MSQGAGIGNVLILALPLLLIVFLFATQRRRAREVQAVQQRLEVGDEVTTTSGLLGRVTALTDQVATLDIGGGVLARFDRRAIAGPSTLLGPALGPADGPADGPSKATGPGSGPLDRPGPAGTGPSTPGAGE